MELEVKKYPISAVGKCRNERRALDCEQAAADLEPADRAPELIGQRECLVAAVDVEGYEYAALRGGPRFGPPTTARPCGSGSGGGSRRPRR